MRSKIALITGGSRGLGKNAALKLAQKGNDIVITYHSQKEEAEKVVAEIERLGQKAIALRLDVADIKSLNNFIVELTAIIKSTWDADGFDFLINNLIESVVLAIVFDFLLGPALMMLRYGKPTTVLP